MFERISLTSACVAGLLVCISCAPSATGGAEAPSAPAATGASGTDQAQAAAPAEIPWAEKDREQRMEFMGKVVYPEMKKLFTAAEPDEAFKCQSCHGDDMEAVDFKMPNSLYALPENDPVGSAKEYDAEVTEFMTGKVVPTMARLMGVEPGAELNCFTCHPKE